MWRVVRFLQPMARPSWGALMGPEDLAKKLGRIAGTFKRAYDTPAADSKVTVQEMVTRKTGVIRIGGKTYSFKIEEQEKT